MYVYACVCSGVLSKFVVTAFIDAGKALIRTYLLCNNYDDRCSVGKSVARKRRIELIGCFSEIVSVVCFVVVFARGLSALLWLLPM